MNDHTICALVLWEQTVRAKQAELQLAALKQNMEQEKPSKPRLVKKPMAQKKVEEDAN